MGVRRRAGPARLVRWPDRPRDRDCLEGQGHAGCAVGRRRDRDVGILHGGEHWIDDGGCTHRRHSLATDELWRQRDDRDAGGARLVAERQAAAPRAVLLKNWSVTYG